MEEVWKDIKDYEGIYQVSNYGNVKSLNRQTFDRVRKQIKRLKGRVLRQAPDTRGYKCVVLTKDEKQKTYRVHNLVAFAFCKGYEKGMVVNHKDENKSNNFYMNLEWCTQKHNIQEVWKTGTAKQRKGKYHPRSKVVNQYDLDGKFIRKWDCILDIQREKGFTGSCICKCCRNKQKTAYGYIWEYEQEAMCGRKLGE